MTPSLLQVTVKAKMMFPRGVAIFAITRQGVETAAKIRDALKENGIKSQIYAPERYAQNGAVPIKRTKDAIKQVFSDVDGIVAVMATGIVVRTIAPLLKSKLSDPAVVCVDTSGKFAISLLSGHYGGANKLTKLVAKGLGATAVITTASDVLGKQSIDELAKKLHCIILNSQSLVGVNSALVNSENLVLVLSGKVKIPSSRIRDYEVRTAKNIDQAIDIVKSFDGGAIISTEIVPQNSLKNVTFLKPKTVAVGIGSRKIVNEKDIVELVTCALTQLEIPLERVDKLATVDIKKDSESILKAAKKLGLNLEFVSIDELCRFSHEDLSVDSQLVKEKIGVGGVCERAALIVAGKNAKLLLKKTKAKGVTVAVAEAE
ncbi:MAG: cobalamin biosynthesis protein [Candidatus Bathyarchaeota archaeon]|nr:cobalamin biosynthesis protein [Candidatus Bathyarchaeum tardum]